MFGPDSTTQRITVDAEYEDNELVIPGMLQWSIKDYGWLTHVAVWDNTNKLIATEKFRSFPSYVLNGDILQLKNLRFKVSG